MYTVLTAISMALLGQVAAPNQADADPATAQKKKWDEFYRAEAASYAISLNGDPAKVLKLRPEPVLLWSNPVRMGDTNGAVFVWTPDSSQFVSLAKSGVEHQCG